MLNVDTTTIPKGSHLGIGAVIRDSRGLVVGAMPKKLRGSFDAFIIECLALREGLQFQSKSKLILHKAKYDVTNIIKAT